MPFVHLMVCFFRRQNNSRQIQLALERLLAQCAIEAFQIGQTLLVAGFEAFDLFDNGGELVLKVDGRVD